MSNEQKFWFIRLGEIGTGDKDKSNIDYKFSYEFYYEHLALRYSAISIGFGLSKSIARKSRTELKKMGIGKEIDEVDNFVNGMQNGDMVLVQMRDPRVNRHEYEYGIAIITDDCKQVKDITGHRFLPSSGGPARKIAWIKRGLKETDFKIDLKEVVMYRKTIKELKRSGAIVKSIFKILNQ